MKRISNKIISLILIMFILMMNVSVLMPKSEAKSKKEYYVKVDRAPRFTVKRNNKNYLIFNLKDSSGIKSVKVEEKVGNKYKTVDKKKLVISKDKQTVKINKSFFKVGERKRIRITASDNDKNSNKIVKNYKVKRLKKANENGNYFLLNHSPEFRTYTNVVKGKNKEETEHKSTITFTAKDYVDNYFDSDSTVVWFRIFDFNGGGYFIQPMEPMVMQYPIDFFNKVKGKYSVELCAVDYYDMQTIEEIHYSLEEKK